MILSNKSWTLSAGLPLCSCGHSATTHEFTTDLHPRKIEDLSRCIYSYGVWDHVLPTNYSCDCEGYSPSCNAWINKLYQKIRYA